MGMLYRGTQGCMYCNGVCCTKECIEETNQKTKMSKEEIITSIYNMIYEQDTKNKKSCLTLSEEITDFIEELIQYERTKSN